MSAKSPRVSGTMVLNQLQAARAMVGDQAIDQALAALTPEQRLEITEILPISWCSLTTVRAFHEATARQLGQHVNAWHLRVVERAMEQTLNTVWRFFLRLTTADALLKRSAAIYSKTFDTGALEARPVAPGHSQATLSGWADVPDYQLNALATGITTLLRSAGRSNVSVKWSRTPDGARFDIHVRAPPPDPASTSSSCPPPPPTM